MILLILDWLQQVMLEVSNESCSLGKTTRETQQRYNLSISFEAVFHLWKSKLILTSLIFSFLSLFWKHHMNFATIPNWGTEFFYLGNLNMNFITSMLMSIHLQVAGLRNTGLERCIMPYSQKQEEINCSIQCSGRRSLSFCFVICGIIQLLNFFNILCLW